MQTDIVSNAAACLSEKKLLAGSGSFHQRLSKHRWETRRRIRLAFFQILLSQVTPT